MEIVESALHNIEISSGKEVADKVDMDKSNNSDDEATESQNNTTMGNSAGVEERGEPIRKLTQ